MEIVIIGAGAAGMLAAYIAAKDGASVRILERNRSVGRKLLITGSGRCNYTNDAEQNELIANVPGNGRFLYSAFKQFSPRDLMELTENEFGVPLKVERGRRVFPTSDRSQDIVAGFERALKRLNVKIETELRADKLLIENGAVVGVGCTNGSKFDAERVIITTGGASYPGTGSTGDGYKLAQQAGHTIQPIFPSLVPFETEETWVKEIEGLTLTNITVSAFHDNKKIREEFGDLLFTGVGVSGPVILTISRDVVPLVLQQAGSVQLKIDLKPALGREEFDKRVQRDFAKFTNKQYKNALDDLLPRSLIPVIIELSGIDPLKPVHQITKEERQRLISLFKELPLTVLRPRSMNEAIVTAGGVNVKEIDPKTMESKLVKGLYFAGEVMDVDAYTGGYNLQIAFSTGYVAGKNASH